MGWWSLCYGDGYIETLIIYSLVANPEIVVKKIQPVIDGKTDSLSNQHAFFSDNSPGLRFSSEGWMHHSPDALIEANNSKLLYDLTIEKVMRGIPTFSISIRKFMRAYLESLSKNPRQIKTMTEEIFTRDDWVYSAWFPMPNTYILLSPEFDREGLNFAEFDVSFWTGKQLICVQLNQSKTMIKSKRRKIEYLESTHPNLKIIEIPSDRVPHSDFPDNLFDDNFNHFWRDLSLPYGPTTQPTFTFTT